MDSLCWNCDFVRLFISIFMYFIFIVCILLSAANGVINDDDKTRMRFGYRMVKKNYDNTLSRFHTIPERNGRICYINIARQCR